MRFTEESEEKLADSSEFSVCTPSTLAAVVLHVPDDLMWVSASLSLSLPSVHTSPSSSIRCCNSYFSWKSGHGPISSKYKICWQIFNFADKYFQNHLTIFRKSLIPKAYPYEIAIANPSHTISFSMSSIHYHSSKHQQVWVRELCRTWPKRHFFEKLLTHFLR